MKYELYRIDTHPIARKFYELGIEIEKLPGGVRQTALITKLAELRQETQDLMNDEEVQKHMRAGSPSTVDGRFVTSATD